jgi:hypothetical protein
VLSGALDDEPQTTKSNEKEQRGRDT